MRLSLLAFMGCNSTSVPNPTGDCDVNVDGSRACYHSPSSTDTYLQDCENPLQREYWRVFAVNEESAYIIPRPDGMGLRYSLCEDSELGVLMETYGLCTEILGANEVTRINDIPPTDALKITHALHAQLVFAVDEHDRIFPWAPPDDVVDACGLSDENDAILETYCDSAMRYYGNGDDCLDIAFFPTVEEATILAARLNTLYGIVPAN